MMASIVENRNYEHLCTTKYPNIALIKTLTNKSLVCRLDFTKTTVNNIIKNLIDKIGYKATNLNVNQINFIHKKKKWFDRDKTLNELGCDGNSVELNMFYSHSNANPKKNKLDVDKVKKKISTSENIVKVKTLTGKVINIKFIDELTCEELKLLIREKINMPIDQQRIIFRGIQFEDNKMLGDYKLNNNDSIHLISRLRGGMFHETSGKNGNYNPLEFAIIDIDINEDKN